MHIAVLSGGGVKGAFQLGVLQSLFRNKQITPFGFEAVFGVSTGALTASVLAQGDYFVAQENRLRDSEAIYLGLTGNNSIYTGGESLLKKMWNLVRHGGFYDPSPLRKLVGSCVSQSQLMRSYTHLGIGVTDLESGKYLTVGKDHPLLHDMILASASQPILFQLDQPWADGGVRNMTPLADVFRWLKDSGRGEEALLRDEDIHLWVIVCNPIGDLARKEINPKNPKDVLLRTFEILMDEAYLSDIRRVLKKNAKPDDDDLPVKVHLFAPDRRLGDGLTFDPAQIRTMLALGANAMEVPSV